MLNSYGYLALAIILEVMATTALKASEGFTRPGPTILVVAGYLTTFWLLTLIMQTLPVGVVYAIWAGAGIVLVTLVSMVIYKQTPDLPAIIGMMLIIAGVTIIHVFSDMSTH
ncbi:multidrug transporter [Terasakiispira papahanaumokuakeensis]|uniref:Multidrug transporter n=1 Tax=Terasakiispira papahanaumokuakeensis TaxID=197479 RepID=A0A1E2VBI7_9GAMM|nr:multidrug efflux SMR transporter [Terasakiispira papahanaumokuakeensis]ODC04331.1 multidrug transporter [Terasakiispira papahanaumokuakeensis]